VANLDRYLDAQNRPRDGFQSALEEIRRGGKRSHWIWYIFPQLRGLGSSGPSVQYAIADVSEARAYLQHPDLRSRLLAITSAVAEQLESGKSLVVVMGSPIDALKLVSSLTLFAHVARELHAERGLDAHRDLAITAEKVLAIADEQSYPQCRFTLERLRASGSDTSTRRE
jgi:uncharacterized protein (DUF1810 family)